MDVTVLLSGGIDSAACVAFYLASGYRVSTFHVDYGQLTRHNERRAATAIAEWMGVPLEVVTIHNARQKADGEIPGRNAMLISLAVLEAGADTRLLAIGVHSGTPYCDCTPEFIGMMNAMVISQTDGVMQVGAPFVAWTKRQIWDFAVDNRVPISLTYSCERGGDVACGECPSCMDMRRLRVG
jgi:7-cyano-7-deazaguanine synthase